MYSKIMAPNNEYNSLLPQNFVLEKCLEKIVFGDKDALAKLYELTKSAVYGFSLSIMKNNDEAEDVLQEVYLKIYDNANLYQSNGKPLAWILTITKNLCYMKLRKQKDTVDIDDMHEILMDDKNNKDIESKMILDAAFNCLSDEERNIVMLHAVAGVKHREIAKILEIPLATVLSKYNRAIKKIKKIVREEDIR